MNTFKLEAGPGDHFDRVAKKAKDIAKDRKVVVEFDFNGIQCLVSETTVCDWLYRDYCNAHIMEWKTVGPDCPMQYDVDVEIDMYSRKLSAAKKRKADYEAADTKDKANRQKVDELVGNSKLAIIPGKDSDYEVFVNKNYQDGYSRAVVDYAEYWGKLMQLELIEGKPLHEIADSTQKHLGFLGITGFQYGAAVNTLATFWIYGDDLRKWHNKQYGVSEDTKGTVNPAILTIG